MDDIDQPLPMVAAQTMRLADLLSESWLQEGYNFVQLAMLAEEFHRRNPPFDYNPYPAELPPPPANEAKGQE